MPDGGHATSKRNRPAPVPPPEASELVACLGPDAALRLIEARGGTRIYVPMPGNGANSVLLDFLDAEPLLRLTQAHGGNSIKVPLCRNWRVLSYLHQGGRSYSEIARLVGVTEHRVQTLSRPDWTPMSSRNNRSAKSDARQAGLAFD